MVVEAPVGEAAPPVPTGTGAEPTGATGVVPLLMGYTGAGATGLVWTGETAVGVLAAVVVKMVDETGAGVEE